jgi:hypothetical protein
MSDTPETDKCVDGNKHINAIQESHWINESMVTFENPIVDLCRRLERERDEAREEIKILRLDAQREAEHHDRLVKELENLYDKLKSQRS